MQQDATHPGDLLDSALDVEALSSEGRKRLLLASEQASAHRIERIRELLIENELDAVYIRDLSNIKWVTAFQGVFDDEAAHALIITPQDAIIHSDSRYGCAGFADPGVSRADEPCELAFAPACGHFWQQAARCDRRHAHLARVPYAHPGARGCIGFS